MTSSGDEFKSQAKYIRLFRFLIRGRAWAYILNGSNAAASIARHPPESGSAGEQWRIQKMNLEGANSGGHQRDPGAEAR